ncbi:hypothetical protein HHI36_014385 [Cryptolaemus montrouzieri]|uniref:Uncharacterized protein n=1 Tax=Cryptolaemus montrouzieri TaxID=559131 RepID=A0ABD2N2L1_9CUCU
MGRISVKFIIFLLLIQANEFEGRKVLHVLRWEDCPEHSNLPISIRSFKLVNYAKNNRTADIRYEIRKKISGNLVVSS